MFQIVFILQGISPLLIAILLYCIKFGIPNIAQDQEFLVLLKIRNSEFCSKSGIPNFAKNQEFRILFKIDFQKVYPLKKYQLFA